MILGFTGTRKGLTIIQFCVLRDMLKTLAPSEVRHGCCIGADEKFHWLLRELERNGEMPAVQIIGHRSNMFDMTAMGTALKCDEQKNPKPPLARNKDIVNASELIIACPQENVEVLRSGTWSTIRYAMKVGKPLVIIYPDGEIERRIGEVPQSKADAAQEDGSVRD